MGTMKEIDKYFLKEGLEQGHIVCSAYHPFYVRAKDIFEAGYEIAQKENNSRLIEYIERKYGIVINRTDLDNFLNREK